MSNYSEGTQVPFGDGSHVPPEEITDSDFKMDTTMQTAMKNIFVSCDPNNSNSALVSDLINFMIPHMLEHSSELAMLRKALDPNDTDPHVDSETFYKVMLEWTNQFMEESVEMHNDHSSSAGELNKVKDQLHGSSSKSSLRGHFLKGCIDSDCMNLSNSSTYSCTGNSGTDVSALQEKINELEHQNRKLTEDLEHSRLQLTNSEEQNEALQADVQRITRRLLVEQQTNGQLEKDRQNTEELMEASAAARKQISKLEKDVISAEKHVSKLKQQIHNLEIENQKFEDRIDQLVKRDTESKQLIQKLQTELHVKEQEITLLEDTNSQINVRLNEQKQLISHYTNVNKSLKEDKLKMEQHYRDTIKNQILTSHLERVSQTFSEFSNTTKSERSLGRPRSKSASSSSSFLKNIGDSSYEDDPFVWKLDQKVAPHESLECEISQAKLLDSENLELKNTLQHVIKEKNCLETEISSSIDKMKNYSPESRENYYETERRALKVRIQDLESDNSHKYIKIIDLMEEKEKLQKELNRVNGKDTDEINKLKQNISELHHDKRRVLRELQQVKWEKENCDTIVKNLQSVKHESDLLQNLLQQSKQNGKDLVKQLDKISFEKYELKTKVDKLKKSMCEVNEKNSELNKQLQNLSDEYSKLKKNIKIRTTKEVGLLKTHDNMNTDLNKSMKKNEELTYEQSCHILEETCKENRKSFHSQVEEMKSLKNIIAEHNSAIDLLKKEITDLSAINSRLSQNTAEKENQIVALKQIVAHQNESLKVVTTDRETSTTRLYEQKYENEKLYENNKELTKNNNQLVKQVERLEKEKEYLGVRLGNLEEENKSILTEFKIITGDYKNMKDSDNKLLKEYKLLVAEKELLTKTNEQLTSDYKKITELKGKIEQQLLDIKNEAMNESNPKQHSPPSEETKHFPKRKSQEIKELNVIQKRIAELENTNKLLQSKNEKLQEDFDGITSSNKTLAKEKEVWVTEKNEWKQLKDDLSKKLNAAMTESKFLEEQLNNSHIGSEESLQKSEGFCSNCLVLKTEIEDLNKRLNELQDQNKNKNQVRRYDRMQVTIEKLKNKSYGTEELLKSEKEKNTKLESENCKLKSEVKENCKKHTKEHAVLEMENSRLHKEVEENLNQYQTEKVDMVAKLSNLEEQLKNLQKDTHEAEQEKRFILQDCNNLKEKLEAVVKEKENRMKSINKETNQLKQEVQELNKQKNKLEKKLETSENLLKCKRNIDKINKENSQLKQEIEEANKQINDYEKKLEKVEQDLKEKLDSEQKIMDCKESVAKENLNIKRQMEDLEKKLEKSQRDLQKSETKNLSIRKEIIDKQAAHDDAAVKSSECGSVEELVQENESLQKQLKNYENELAEIKTKLSDSSNCLHLLSEYVKDVNQQLNEKRNRLHCSTLTAVSNWRATLEEPDTKTVLEVFDKGELATPQQTFTGPLDEEMFKFKHQIHVTSLILDTLGHLKTLHVSMTSSQDAEIQVGSSSPLSCPRKCVKKFTSTTKPGSSRSVSPDSPLQKSKLGNVYTRDVRSKTAPPSLVQSREASPTNEAKLSRPVRPNSPSKNIKLQSTDTSPLNMKHASAIPIQSRETSPVNKSKKYVSSNSRCGCAIDAKPVACHKLPQDYDSEDSMLSEDEEVEVGRHTNKNSPSLSVSTLESLGLLYEGDSPNWSKKEIEEKFHILVTCFMMDVVTIKDRYRKQHTHQSKIENRFSLESEKVVATLKEIKKWSRDQQIKDLVTTCLGHVKQIVGVFSQISILATQCGALQHEQHSLKIINVMINHAANLRQVVENTTPRLKSTGSSSNSPKYRKSRDVLVRNSSSSSVQSKDVSSIFELNNDGREFLDRSLNEAEEMHNFNHHVLPSVSCGLNSGVKKFKDEHYSRVGTGVIRKMLLFFLLLFLTVIVAIVLIGVDYTSDGISVRGYPWHWASWNDIFAPFVKVTYLQGPPPT